MRRSLAAAVVLLLSLWAAGCASVGGGLPRPPTSGSPGAQEASEEAPASTRTLYRISYQGPGGGGSLRLALLLAERGHYQARASDAFGRGLWSLELEGDAVLVVDHRRREHCATDRTLRLPELALASVPLDRLPDVLAGRLPARAADPAADPLDFVDSQGQRWTATRDGEALTAWTLWSEGRPLLWWSGGETAGVLSHRRGSQFRWRRSVSEPLDGDLPDLAVPDVYRRTDCASFAPGELSTPDNLTVSPQRF